jgi:methionine synthase I (cobalamin-dependent)
MKLAILERARRSGLLFDGAMGSLLIQAEIPPGTPSELWNAERPEVILEIHRRYLAAGAEILTTNSFGGSRLKLAKSGLAERVRELNLAAATIARQAAGQRAFVAGDIGPSGEMLQPYGLVSPEELTKNFVEQAKALVDGGVDAFIVVTMFDVNEALVAIAGIKKVSNLPIFATLTFEFRGGRFATVMGNPVADSMEALRKAGAAAVGANCSIGSDQMVALAAEIRKCTDGLVVIQPNAGIPEQREKRIVYPESPDFFAANLGKIKKLGFEVIGGCCGTTPEYIARIATVLSQKTVNK